jgi:hypothetical protein
MRPEPDTLLLRRPGRVSKWTLPEPEILMSASVDALSEVGVTHIDMPVTPEKVSRILNGGL